MENSITDIITKYNSIYNALERNDIGTAVAPVIILYMYLMIQGKEKNKLYLRRIIIMSVIMLLCGKRSAMVAIGVALIVFWVLSLNIKDKLKFCYLLSMFTMGVLYVFVVAVKTGVLEWICLKIGISTQGRVYVWSWFDDQYNLSPFYMGKGFQYVHKYMEAYIAERGVITSMVSNFGYLHNSILQIFIELGFAGFFLWFVFYLIFYPNNLRKIFGVNTYYLCVILMVCNVWMYMTDNTLTYPIYQSTLYIALFSYVFFEKKTRSGDAIRNDDVNHCCSV
jgi:O-antigen ligase